MCTSPLLFTPSPNTVQQNAPSRCVDERTSRTPNIYTKFHVAFCRRRKSVSSAVFPPLSVSVTAKGHFWQVVVVKRDVCVLRLRTCKNSPVTFPAHDVRCFDEGRRARRGYASETCSLLSPTPRVSQLTRVTLWFPGSAGRGHAPLGGGSPGGGDPNPPDQAQGLQGLRRQPQDQGQKHVRSIIAQQDVLSIIAQQHVLSVVAQTMFSQLSLSNTGTPLSLKPRTLNYR